MDTVDVLAVTEQNANKGEPLPGAVRLGYMNCLTSQP